MALLLSQIRIFSNQHKLSSSIALVRHLATPLGTLSQGGQQRLRVIAAENSPDDPDGYDKIERPIGPRKNDYYYKYEITKHARQGPAGIKRALELFKQMKSVDRLTPTVHNFSPLIYGCARAGYTKKAFDLYEEFLTYFKRPTQSIVTCLINSCAECPFPEYGLKRLEWIKLQLKNSVSYSFNRLHYAALIKAYGRLGRLDIAGKTLQEMIDSGLMPDIDHFNAMLTGCASDQQKGLAQAITYFRRIRNYGLTPTYDTYHLMLRCVRDCNIEGIDAEKRESSPADQLLDTKSDADTRSLEHLTSINSDLLDRQQQQHSVVKTHNSLYALPDVLQTGTGTELKPFKMPNLLFDPTSQLQATVKSINYDVMHIRYNRLLLVGGVVEFLDRMISEGIKPDVRIFDMILSCLPLSQRMESELLELMEVHSVKPNDGIYSRLILRATTCKHLKPAQRLERCLFLLEEMQTEGIRPTLKTFEAIAGACSTLKAAQTLIRNMDELGLVLSSNFMAKLFWCSLDRNDFMHMVKLINLCRSRNINPPSHLIEELEAKRSNIRQMLLDLEQGRLTEKPDYVNDKFIRRFDLFTQVFKSWIRDTLVESNNEHPWSQFSVDNSYGREGFDEFVSEMKTRHDSYWSKHERPIRTPSSVLSP